MFGVAVAGITVFFLKSLVTYLNASFCAGDREEASWAPILFAARALTRGLALGMGLDAVIPLPYPCSSAAIMYSPAFSPCHNLSRDGHVLLGGRNPTDIWRVIRRGDCPWMNPSHPVYGESNMARQRPKPRKPETESKEKTSTQSDTVNLSPEELKSISGGAKVRPPPKAKLTSRPASRPR
jgi:hypothetical protein